jgi:predicted porin
MRVAIRKGWSHSGFSSNRLQKTLLATAVASACALPALAQAQIQVTPGLQIYGRANVSYERITVKNSTDPAVPNESNWDLVDNSSRVGFRGRKELTPGLFGHFQIESRVRLDTGGSTAVAGPSGALSDTAFLSSRDSYAGLDGGFGNVRLGRTIGPVYYATYDYISLHNHDTGTSADALLAPGVFGRQGFMNNTVWYTSPKFGAFTVDVAHSLLNVSRLPGESQPRYLGLVGSFDQGPLHVAASYANTKQSADVDPTGAVVANNDKVYTIGGLYDLKAFVVGALFERAKSKIASGADASRNYFRFAAMMPLGKHEFHANFGTTNGRLDADLTDDGAKQWTLAYNYNITKETKVYAFFTTVNNDTNGNYGFVTASPGADNRSIAAGVRHNF